jgi:predicted ATP-dependent endonuclease of OLD family
MKLQKVRVQKYQNFIDSGEVKINEDITCLVGKNESGKTAFLQALHKLNPHHPSEFKALEQYPRWRYKLDERDNAVNTEPVVSVIFDLEPKEIESIEDVLGEDILVSNTLTVSRYYNGEIEFQIDANHLQILKNYALDLPEDSALRKATSQKKSTESFIEEWKSTWADVESPTEEESVINKLVENGFSGKLQNVLSEFLPTIFYFGEYSSLPGRIKLEDFLSKSLESLNSGKERTTNALLELAGADRESIKTDEFEDRIAELEASASLITQSVLEYWSQNNEISVDFKVDKEVQPQGNRKPPIISHYLDIRLRDLIHDITINFDRRSSGFKWFFSFLVAFSEFKDEDKNLIILLDEPGLSLHAKAQNDLLNFIKDELSPDHQVIYTTHSPFMVDPKKLNQVRLVEDSTTRKNRVGAKVTSDVFSTNYDTIFPLQSALGYDMAQNLFVGRHNIIIEGTSDFVYLNVMSRFLEGKGRSHLDFSTVTLTPVGGASKIATFVALLGQHLDATVFMDADKKESQRVGELIERGLLENEKYLTPADFIEEMREADIEDLFIPEDYLKLYNDTFEDDLKLEDLNGDDPIVRRITRARQDYDHGKPADLLLRNSDKYLKEFSDETIEKFEEVISMLNETIER